MMMMWGIAGVLCVLNTLLFFIFLVVGNLFWAIKDKIAVGQSWEKQPLGNNGLGFYGCLARKHGAFRDSGAGADAGAGLSNF